MVSFSLRRRIYCYSPERPLKNSPPVSFHLIQFALHRPWRNFLAFQSVGPRLFAFWTASATRISERL